MDETGRLFSWGDNSKGQLGDNALGSDSKHPARIGSDSNWAGVSAGESHTLAVKKDGTLWAWGNHADGRLGVGVVTADRKAPVQVGGSAHWILASAGSRHSLAVDNNGGLWAWGANDSGQLGYSAAGADNLTPKRVGTDTDWIFVSAGENYSLAIKKDGRLMAWGANVSGQLGNGTKDTAAQPELIPGSIQWEFVSAGKSYPADSSSSPGHIHSLGIAKDGRLYAWGANGSGRLGDGGTDESLVPKRIGSDTDWKWVNAAGGGSLGVKTSGELMAWGANGSGRLGSGDTNAINTPTRIGDAAGWSLAALGDNHGVALNAGNGVFTWGANTKGQLGGDEKTRIVQVGADKGWSTAAAGEGFSLGVKNNELFTWGKNDNGQLAGGSTSTAPNGVPTSRGTGWTKVSAGDEHALALKSGGTGSTNVQLFAWGAKGAGRLGIGSLTVFQESESQATPGRESTNSNDWAEISAGSVHGMGLRNGNEAAGFELWAWGFNASGHVGNSTSDKQFSPVRINTPGAANTKWKTIAGGTEHSLAIRSDGSLWAWGSYEYGRLTTDWGGSFAPRSGNRTAPFRIGTDTDWKAVSAGTNHSLALKGDGTLWAWGLNDSGQLGYTAADTLRTLSGVTFRGRKTPGQVGTDSDWDKIYAGFDHSLAIRTDGTLWAWGGEFFRSAGFRYAPGRDWGIDFSDNAEAGGAFSELGRYQHRRPLRG